MEMTDILPVSGWAEVEREIFERFGVNAHVYNAKGAPFTGYVTWGNRLCPALREDKSAATAICAVINQVLGVEVRATRKPAISDCDAGLLVVCVPLFVGDEFVGMVGGCGGFMDDAEAESFLIEKTSGLSEERIAELCSDMNHMTSAEVQAVADYIEGRVAGIVQDFMARRA